MLEETQDVQEIIARVAALDIGKAELVCCVRARPYGWLAAGPGGHDVLHDDPLAADHGRPVAKSGGDPVVMESTSSYWKTPFYLLEAHGFQTWLVNAKDAKDVKHLPGRPKNRPAGRGVVVQGSRTADAAAQLRATGPDPAAS